MGQANRPGLPRELRALAAEPAAVCVTFSISGSTLVEPPTDLEELFEIASTRDSPLDGLCSSSRGVAVSLFELARRQGSACGEVRLEGVPDRPCVLHVFDLAATHGCFVGVVRPVSAAADETAGVSTLPRPRRMVVELGLTGLILSVDDAFVRALGWKAEDVVQRSALEFIHQQDHARSIGFWSDLLGEAGATCRLRQRWLHADGSWVWMEVTETNLLHDPERGAVFSELVDISDEMAAQNALHEREELLVRLTEALPMGILYVDSAGLPVLSNPRWFEITGLAAGTGLRDLIALTHPSSRTGLTNAVAQTLRSGTGDSTELEFALTTPDDEPRVCRLRLCALNETTDGPSVLASLEDITQRHQLHRRLVEAAERDPLTRLLNRSAIVERLEVTLDRASADDLSVGLLFVDLDDFKLVNDRFGHATGDDLLKRVGDTIKRCVRHGDLVGRLGGDEFVVVVPDLVDIDVADALAARIKHALSEIVVARGERLITGSVGVSGGPARTTTANELLAAADAAMYEAKRKRIST